MEVYDLSLRSKYGLDSSLMKVTQHVVKILTAKSIS